MIRLSRRSLMAGAGSGFAALAMGRAQAQSKTKLRFSCAFPEDDLRAEAYKAFAAAIKDDFEIEPYWSNTLFKQGTELVALQRDNLEMCNLAPADISKQIPAWSLMTSAYLFRDYDHLKKTFRATSARNSSRWRADQLGIEVIRPVYFGARQVNLKPDKMIKTPADLAGIKLRMPPGEFWQFLGESLGANPTPVAYAELYTALQTGAVDGQDNPLVAGRTMKFYEVTSQFVLTRHVHRLRHAAIRRQEGLGRPERGRSRPSSAPRPTRPSTPMRRNTTRRKPRRSSSSRRKARRSTSPTRTPSATFAQKKYVDQYGKDWPKGAIEKINAVNSQVWRSAASDQSEPAGCAGRPLRNGHPKSNTPLTSRASTVGRWLRRRAKNVLVRVAVDDVRDLHLANFRTLCAEQSGGLVRGGHRRGLALDGAVGRGLRLCVRPKKSASTSSTHDLGDAPGVS